MHEVRTSLSLALIALLSACAPGLNGKLQVADFSESEPQALASLSRSEIRVSVQPFDDARKESAIGSYNGEDLQPEGNPGAVVQSALEHKLKARGARIALFNAPRVEGKIKEWFVNVRPSFPTADVEANAAIELQLVGVDGKPFYRASYSGQFNQQKPMFSQDRIEEVLWLAMNEALNEALSDGELLSRLEGAGR